MDSSQSLSFQEALEGWRAVRQCETRGLMESAAWLREFLGCSRNAEVSASAALAVLDEADELKELSSCCVPRALHATALLRRGDFFGVSSCASNGGCLHMKKPEEQPPLLVFTELFAELSREQTRAANWVVAGKRREGEVVSLKPGRLQAAVRKASDILEAAASKRRLDAFGWWLLARVRKAQQRQPECIAALVEALRLCRCFVAAWDDLTLQLAGMLYANGLGAPAAQSLEGSGRLAPHSARSPGAASAAEGSGDRLSGVAWQQRQEEQQAMETDRGEEAWGGCVISAAAATAAAAIAAEALGGLPHGEACLDTAFSADNGSSATAAVVNSLCNDGADYNWATPSFLSEQLLGASRSAFLKALGLPAAGVYGEFFFAVFCLRTNRFADAAAELAHLSVAFPKCPLILAQLAKCSCELGDESRALEFFSLLGELNPSRLDFVSDFARLLVARQDLQGLQRLAERCQEVSPGSFGTLLVSAHLARFGGSQEEAVEILHAATALNPTYAAVPLGVVARLADSMVAPWDCAKGAEQTFECPEKLSAGEASLRREEGPPRHQELCWARYPSLETTLSADRLRFEHGSRRGQGGEHSGRMLRLLGTVGPLTPAVWAERLFEGYLAKVLSLEGSEPSRLLLRKFYCGARPRDGRLAAALQKAPEAVLRAIASLAVHYQTELSSGLTGTICRFILFSDCPADSAYASHLYVLVMNCIEALSECNCAISSTDSSMTSRLRILYGSHLPWWYEQEESVKTLSPLDESKGCLAMQKGCLISQTIAKGFCVS
ncbi:hypothetical protein cyc_02693 [Cyclospora cayetanensis]|uniref:Uncharacterized protein n=1 Tax=Cyclospora cayetanensis TaxID=88456 RepID=A0A1D3CY48_9EIME|nr:hypothetical protein cyc_02693 [Cyclospora cayetanensis]